MSDTEVTELMKNPKFFVGIKDEIKEGTKRMNLIRRNHNIKNADFGTKRPAAVTTTTKATRKRRPMTAVNPNRAKLRNQRQSSAKTKMNKTYYKSNMDSKLYY